MAEALLVVAAMKGASDEDIAGALFQRLEAGDEEVREINPGVGRFEKPQRRW